MAAFDTSRPAYGTIVAVARISSFVADVLGNIVAWRDARATRKALASLTDRELDDIGLIRGDIDVVAQSYFIR